MVPSVYQAYQGDHFASYVNVQPLCCTNETKNKIKNKNPQFTVSTELVNKNKVTINSHKNNK